MKFSEDPDPLYINKNCVERVPVCSFLGTHIAEDRSWTTTNNTTTVVRKTQQRQYFLGILRDYNQPSRRRCSIENVLTYCISVWYTGCSAVHRRALQRVINIAQKITACSLPSLEDLFSSRCLGRAADTHKRPF